MGFSAGKNLENNINTTEAQTLSNKTLDNSNLIDGSPIENSTITGASIESPERIQLKQYDDLASAQADISNRNGGELIYVNDIKKTFQVNDDGLGTKTLAEISGGQGGVNYIENSDFEQGVDGYTDDTNFTISQTELVAEVLRGTASAKLSKAAVDASNEEISVPFTVSRADLSKKITISFEYDASDPNYADNDILIGVRQDPNNTPIIIIINGEDLKGGKGTHYAQFQTDASQTEYELFFKVNSTNSSAYDVIIDDVKVGPREVVKGAAMTDWQSYTPTTQGFGSATINFQYKRSGDSIIIRGNLTAGTTTADEARINLPLGLSIGGSASGTTVGAWFRGVSVGSNGGAILATQGDSFLNFSASSVFNTTGTNPVTRANGNNVLASSERMYFTTTEIPIQGWSSNAVTSEDLGGREIVVEAYGNDDESITAATEDIPFKNIVIDTAGAWTNAGNTGSNTPDAFTTPETGYYDITYSVRTSTNTQQQIRLYIDGVAAHAGVHPASYIIQQGSFTSVYLEKGQVVTFRSDNSVTLASGASSLFHKIRIAKRASPQTILETETVAESRGDISGQAIADAGDTTVTFDTSFHSTHNALGSNGIFTAPASGFYSVKALITYTDSAWSIGHVAYLVLKGNISGTPTTLRYMQRIEIQDTVNQRFTLGGSSDVYLNKGDTIWLDAFQNKGAPLSLYTGAGGAYNHLSISRIK